MKLRDRIRRHSRDNRAIAAVLLGLFLVLAAVFYLILRSRDLPSYLVTDRLLLFVLLYVNGILILTILFVLLRNVYKLLVERHNRILGSKFKIKLVASFIGLSLIPVLLLFFIATELFQGTMDRWFSTQVREVREQGNAVAEALSDQVESTALRDAGQVRRAIADLDLADPAAKPELARRLAELPRRARPRRAGGLRRARLRAGDARSAGRHHRPAGSAARADRRGTTRWPRGAQPRARRRARPAGAGGRRTAGRRR